MPTITKQTAVSPKKTKPTGSVRDRIRPVAEAGDDWMRINVFGRNGTGKTAFACTFPKPLLLIGFEDGTKTVRRVKDVDFVLVEKTVELFDLIDLAREGKYQTVVVDTATSLQDLVLKEIMGLDDVPVQLAWGMVTQRQYFDRSDKTRELLRKFVYPPFLPCHVVILAQEKNHSDKASEEVAGAESDLITPFVAASLGKTTAGWLNERVDYICQTFVREVTREVISKVGEKTIKMSEKTGAIEFCLRTQRAHPVYAAKVRADRSVAIPEVLPDPSYAKLIKVLSGEK